MTFLWLCFWIIYHTPDVQIQPELNDWAIALAICLGLDLMGALKRRSGVS